MANIAYVADYSDDYEEATCRFFKTPKDAEAWANNNEDYENQFKFGEDIETGSYEITSGIIKYSKGLVVAINGPLGGYSFSDQFMIEAMSQEDCIAEIKKLKDGGSTFDEMYSAGAFYTKAIPGNGDDADWLLGGGGGTEFNNGRKDFDFYYQEGQGEISYNSGKSESLEESVKTFKNVKLFEEFVNEYQENTKTPYFRELVSRMESMVDRAQYKKMISAMDKLLDDWYAEGYEKGDVLNFFNAILPGGPNDT